jgi:hypothetical protein
MKTIPFLSALAELFPAWLLGTTQNTRHHSGRKIFSKTILAEHPFIANLASNSSIPPLEHNPPFSA